MPALNRRADVSDQEYLEEQVRALQLQLAESKGRAQGAIDLGLQISTRASDADARLVSMGQSRNRLLREHQLMVQVIADLMADISEGRDPVKSASRMVASLALQGVMVSGAIQQAINLRAGRGVTEAPPADVPAAPSQAPRTEREYWQDIADALNAATATGRPVGIDVDGTLTDHFAWSVVWDRQAERWTVGGYQEDLTGAPPAASATS